MQKPSNIHAMPLNRTPFKTDFELLAKEIVLNELKEFDCKIFLFGSRASKENHRFSDMDIGILPGKDFNAKFLIPLKEKLNDSVIPFKADVVNFNQISDKFKKHALQNIVWWRK